MERTQALRDLQWVIESRSLIDGTHVADAGQYGIAGIAPDELAAFLREKRSHRVGRYFERLVLFWLERIRKVRIVASGLQIGDGNRTLGEIDFIFEDEQGRLNHWETAVKFFLHFPNEDGSHFPGPNASDNFERKMSKLLDTQLRFSEQHYPNVEIRRAFVKGMMFYHPDVAPPDVLPAHLSPGHQKCVWIREFELEWFDAHEGCVGKVLQKPHWLAPPGPGECGSVGELQTELTQHFAQSRSPVMVSLLSGADEKTRLFVAPDSWPEA